MMRWLIITAVIVVPPLLVAWAIWRTLANDEPFDWSDPWDDDFDIWDDDEDDAPWQGIR